MEGENDVEGGGGDKEWGGGGDETGGFGDDTGEGGADKSAAYSSSPVLWKLHWLIQKASRRSKANK